VSTIPGKAPAVRLPPQVDTPQDMLVEQLGRLLTVEATLSRRVMPLLAARIADDELKQAVEQHAEQTRAHVERIRDAFSALGEEPTGKPAPGLEGLSAELEALLPEVAPALRPGLECESAMAAEHYEINVYDSTIRLAESMGRTEVAALLRANLAEETQALQLLAAHSERLAQLAVEQRTAPP
jgi:ferritin-like metal-binding protein YciE